MVNTFIIAIAVFAVSSTFIGVMQGLWLAGLYLGVAFLVIGLLTMSSSPFRKQFYRRNMTDPEWERTHSKREKDFFDHYYFPPRGIIGGIGLIFLFWLTHQQLLLEIVDWLRRSVLGLYS
jgi:hypothetical protein